MTRNERLFRAAVSSCHQLGWSIWRTIRHLRSRGMVVRLDVIQKLWYEFSKP